MNTKKKNNIYQARLGRPPDLEKRLNDASIKQLQSRGSIIRQALYKHLHEEDNALNTGIAKV